MGADQFEEIIKSIDGDHNVTAIWGRMSDLIFKSFYRNRRRHDGAGPIQRIHETTEFLELK